MSVLLGAVAGRWGAGSETEQLLGPRDVVLGDLGGAGQAPGHLRGHLLQVVAKARLLAADLARPGHLEALAGTGVGLVLRHGVVSYVVRGSVVNGQASR